MPELLDNFTLLLPMYEWPSSSAFSSAVDIVTIFYTGHSDSHVMVIHGFNLGVPNDWWYPASYTCFCHHYILFVEIPIFIFCTFYNLIDFLNCCVWGNFFKILDMNYLIYGLQVVTPDLYHVFHPLNSELAEKILKFWYHPIYQIFLLWAIFLLSSLGMLCFALDSEDFLLWLFPKVFVLLYIIFTYLHPRFFLI